MLADTTMKRYRIDSQRGRHSVCEYVENAPWNRKELFDPPRYRGVGSVLIRAAVVLSEDLEFHGWIGLHSLPQVNGVHADTCGMNDLGLILAMGTSVTSRRRPIRLGLPLRARGIRDEAGHREGVVHPHGAA